MLTIYRGVTAGAEPLVRHYLARRVRTGKEDPDRLSERFGEASERRPAGRIVWIHAASVGESLSMLPLIGRIVDERPHLNLLMTTGTVTSARMMRERLPASVIHQYVPVDRAAWVNRFLDHWRPDLALWVESEFWPNLLCAIGERRIPLVLVNARISEKSYRGWRRARSVAGRLLRNFDLCLAQTPDDARKLKGLGALTVRSPGNLKFAAPPLPFDAAQYDALSGRLAGRPVWLAASTHPGEETVIAAAHEILRGGHPGLLTILVPRHAGRGASIAEELGARGHAVALRSRGDTVAPDTAFYVADTMGELGLFLRLAPIAFIGGSLIPHGGQNPLEAAQLGAAILHGPHMTNFHAIVRDLHAAGAAAVTADAAAIAAEVAALLGDETQRARRTAAANAVAKSKRGVLEQVVYELGPYLDRLHGVAEDTVRHARA